MRGAGDHPGSRVSAPYYYRPFPFEYEGSWGSEDSEPSVLRLGTGITNPLDSCELLGVSGTCHACLGYVAEYVEGRVSEGLIPLLCDIFLSTYRI